MRALSKIANAIRGHKKSIVFDQKITRIPTLETRAHSTRSIRSIDLSASAKPAQEAVNSHPSPARPKVRREPYSVSSEIKLEARTVKKSAANVRAGVAITVHMAQNYVLDLTKLPIAEGLTKRTRGQTALADPTVPINLNQRVLDAKFEEIGRPIHCK